jgi:hypothetical protein
MEETQMKKFSYLKLAILLKQLATLLDELDIEYLAIKRNKK